MKNRWRKVFLISLALGAALLIGSCAYVQHPKFGTLPDGDRRAIIERSPHYVDGEFRNLMPTPMFAEDRSLLSVFISNRRIRAERLRPESEIPSVRTDLKVLEPDEDIVVWFGHSSYFVQLGGKRLLIDPVFSSDAAPVRWANRAFEGTSSYSAQDMPEIDYLLITHDHWDHLDYPTVVALKPKVGKVITGLGVGAHFERWGYPSEMIREGDWYTALDLDEGFSVHILPARHYSGRSLRRNQTLWVGFALETPQRRLFFSGDSGYGPHFEEIGHRFGGFDLVALDIGQYDPRWPYIHKNPEEGAQAAQDLRGKALLPGHIGRFSLAKHPWDDPFERIAAASEGKDYRLLLPRIGEPIRLDDEQQRFSRWWEEVDREG